MLAYKTGDFGRTWSLITSGLRAGEPVRVVRESPDARGVLFAGTESGTYVSFDDGARWTPFSQNLPQVPVTDLIARHGDLVASTEGRSFWILDDVAAIATSRGVRPAGDAVLLPARNAPPWTLGQPRGGWLRPQSAERRHDDLLPQGRAGQHDRGVTRFQGRAGAPVAQLLHQARRQPVCRRPACQQPERPGRPRPEPIVSTWDLREETLRARPACSARASSAGAAFRRTLHRHAHRKGSASSSSTVQFDVRRDPRAELMADAEVARVNALLGSLTAALDDLNSTVNELRDARNQVGKAAERSKEAPNKTAIDSAAKSIVDRWTRWKAISCSPGARPSRT